MGDHGILDVRINLDVKIQRRPQTMKDPGPEVFSADFDNAFAVCKFQAINIAETNLTAL